MKKHIRLLAIFALLSMIGLAAMTLLFQNPRTQFEYQEENTFSELMIIRDSNGSISSFQTDALDVHGDGEFNATIPGLTGSVNRSLDDTVYEVAVEAMYHVEFLGEQESLVDLWISSDLKLTYENEILDTDLPGGRYSVSEGLRLSSTRNAALELNNSIIERNAISSIGVSLSAMFQAECNTSYAMHYALTLDIIFIHQIPSPRSIPTATIAFLGLGIISTGLLLEEIRRME